MWAQFVNILIGLWLMISPAVLQSDNAAAVNAQITGPLIITMAVIALSQSVRNVRYINVAGGVWLMASPWLLDYTYTSGYINDSIAGLAVIVFSFIKGKITYSFGGGWRSLFQQDPPHLRETEQ